MSALTRTLHLFLWPGNRFCGLIGSSPAEDSGMLRGFINSIVWGLIAAILIWKLL